MFKETLLIICISAAQAAGQTNATMPIKVRRSDDDAKIAEAKKTSAARWPMEEIREIFSRDLAGRPFDGRMSEEFWDAVSASLKAQEAVDRYPEYQNLTNVAWEVDEKDGRYLDLCYSNSRFDPSCVQRIYDIPSGGALISPAKFKLSLKGLDSASLVGTIDITAGGVSINPFSSGTSTNAELVIPVTPIVAGGTADISSIIIEFLKDSYFDSGALGFIGGTAATIVGVNVVGGGHLGKVDLEGLETYVPNLALSGKQGSTFTPEYGYNEFYICAGAKIKVDIAKAPSVADAALKTFPLTKRLTYLEDLFKDNTDDPPPTDTCDRRRLRTPDRRLAYPSSHEVPHTRIFQVTTGAGWSVVYLVLTGAEFEKYGVTCSDGVLTGTVDPQTGFLLLSCPQGQACTVACEIAYNGVQPYYGLDVNVYSSGQYTFVASYADDFVYQSFPVTGGYVTNIDGVVSMNLADGGSAASTGYMPYFFWSVPYG